MSKRTKLLKMEKRLNAAIAYCKYLEREKDFVNVKIQGVYTQLKIKDQEIEQLKKRLENVNEKIAEIDLDARTAKGLAEIAKIRCQNQEEIVRGINRDVIKLRARPTGFIDKLKLMFAGR